MTENFFANERQKYTFKGHYAHGTFSNNQKQEFENDVVQLHANEKTVESFNHARRFLGAKEYRNSDELDQANYQTSTKQVTKLLHESIMNDLEVVRESSEFICDIGNQDAQHTLRLIQYHSKQVGDYLVLMAGAPMLEAVLAELGFEEAVFEAGQNGQFYANPDNFLKATGLLAKHYFDLDVADNLVAQTDVFAIGGPFINLTNAFGNENDQMNRVCFLARVK